MTLLFGIALFNIFIDSVSASSLEEIKRSKKIRVHNEMNWHTSEVRSSEWTPPSRRPSASVSWCIATTPRRVVACQ